MRKNLSAALALVLLLGSVALLAACNTTSGAGRDLSAAGHAVTDTAEKARPR
jgi:predicted small secreted protein